MKRIKTLKSSALKVLFGMTVLGTLMFTGCPQKSGSKPTPTVTKYKVDFGVDGSNGTLTATVDGKTITSGTEVEKDKTVVFTATPDTGFKVKAWTLDGAGVNGTNGTYSLKITKAVKIKVSFGSSTPAPPPDGTVVYTVEHWKQNLAGTDYEKADTETKTGSVGAQTEAQAKTYSGFTAKLPITQSAIKADGSTVVKVYYDRKTITLTLNLDGGSTSTPLTGGKLIGRFGAAVPAVAAPTKTGYTFKGWNPWLPPTFPANDGTHTAQWEEVLYDLTFSVEGNPANGTLSAELDGTPITTSPYKVQEGKTVVFTATPANANILIKKWTVTPPSALTEGGTDGSLTAKVKITAETTVRMSFEAPPPGSAVYRVEHWKQNVEGTGYTKADTEQKTGAVGAQTLAQEKNYPGFTAKAVTQVPIAADGSTVVKIEYDRKTITLTLILDGGIMDPPIPGNKLTGRFGQALPPVTEPTRDGYGFMDWEPELPASFPANDGTYTAEWQAYTDIPYTVEHWKQDIAGTTYTKAETETKTGSPDTPTQAQAKNYPGFTAQPVMQVPIAGDGSTVVKIKYDRKMITLTLNLNGGNMDPSIPGNKLTGRFGQAVPEVTAPTKMGYIFKGWNPPLPETFPAHDGTHSAQWAYIVSWEAGNGGLIKVNSGDFAKRGSDGFEYGTRLTFTAKPDADYKVQKWYLNSTSTGISALTYEYTVTDYALVYVEFTEVYAKVPYSNLEAYLAGASNSEVNYIEITGTIPAADFAGNPWPVEAGALGQKIKRYPSKKVALKLPQNVPGLTDMTSCFAGCTNLLSLKNIPSGVKNMMNCFYKCSNFTEAPVIPSSVKNMESCFSQCSKLTKAPVIPSSVNNMALCFSSTALTEGPDIPASVTNMKQCFAKCVSLKRVKLNCNYSVDGSKEAFFKCPTLEPGGIQVPSAYYDYYVDPPSLYNMYVPGDTVEEKRAKFSRF